MKKLGILFFVVLLLYGNTNSSSFCDGWEDGYKEGYCYRVQGCIAPPPPVCPVPYMNEERYKDGYNRGFIRGKKDRNE